jgi:hypothetical protein
VALISWTLQATITVVLLVAFWSMTRVLQGAAVRSIALGWTAFLVQTVAVIAYREVLVHAPANDRLRMVLGAMENAPRIGMAFLLYPTAAILAGQPEKRPSARRYAIAATTAIAVAGILPPWRKPRSARRSCLRRRARRWLDTSRAMRRRRAARDESREADEHQDDPEPTEEDRERGIGRVGELRGRLADFRARTEPHEERDRSGEPAEESADSPVSRRLRHLVDDGRGPKDRLEELNLAGAAGRRQRGVMDGRFAPQPPRSHPVGERVVRPDRAPSSIQVHRPHCDCAFPGCRPS